jgi:hypothetical protein
MGKSLATGNFCLAGNHAFEKKTELSETYLSFFG